MSDQDKRIREYYDNLCMRQDKINVLLRQTVSDTQIAKSSSMDCGHDLQAQHTKTPKPVLEPAGVHWWKGQRINWLSAALTCCVFMAVSMWMHSTGSDTERMQRTVREVALNHTTRLDPEFRGQALAMLDNSMQQLPFALVLPKSIDSAYKLIGSRYCSLGGVLAAHVRLKYTHSGKPVSLFVTSNAIELKNIRALHTTHEGVDMQFWREGGLFYAMAQRS